ncbi:MAG: endonuclease/exonuclease/phosphatase family protein [Bacteroides sp.]|nr:endonuclease/exonuclease/phosphatase family protein [Prevotella sp.]MCM1407677.1 endonuclease/exonuclease/phosphatase family protein [Treponema brennaborense]MCM1469173.1 endonuclease/exonuclease/phosphatase family protein [Bacteroides sp.]
MTRTNTGCKKYRGIRGGTISIHRRRAALSAKCCSFRFYFALPSFLSSVFFLLFLLFGCRPDAIAVSTAAPRELSEMRVSVASWNAQTFFDAAADGTEYKDFSGSQTSWTEEKYSQRLERISRVITALDADIVALQEIENASVVQDIINYLPQQASSRKAYRYSCFAKEPNGVFGNAVLSRYPLGKCSVHQVDVRSGKNQPPMRPLLKTTVFAEKNGARFRLFSLYVCHWKSKAGGTDSEIWRKKQEQMLAEQLFCEQKNGNKFVACGDFNQDISEFIINPFSSSAAYTADRKNAGETPYNPPNVLLAAFSRYEDGTPIFVPAYNPWSDSSSEGSYMYRQSWEKIDHFFTGSGVYVSDFSAADRGEHVSSSGAPFRYTVFNGRGYSDHLPVRAVICTVPVLYSQTDGQ